MGSSPPLESVPPLLKYSKNPRPHGEGGGKVFLVDPDSSLIDLMEYSRASNLVASGFRGCGDGKASRRRTIG